MKFLVVLALFALAAAEPEAEPDPYLLFYNPPVKPVEKEAKPEDLEELSKAFKEILKILKVDVEKKKPVAKKEPIEITLNKKPVEKKVKPAWNTFEQKKPVEEKKPVVHGNPWYYPEPAWNTFEQKKPVVYTNPWYYPLTYGAVNYGHYGYSYGK